MCYREPLALMHLELKEGNVISSWDFTYSVFIFHYSNLPCRNFLPSKAKKVSVPFTRLHKFLNNCLSVSMPIKKE